MTGTESPVPPRHCLTISELEDLADMVPATPGSEQTPQDRLPTGVVGPADAGELLRLLTDCVMDYALFTLDSGGRIASWNRGCERLLGYAAAEIVDRHFAHFYTEEARQKGEPDRHLASARGNGEFDVETNWTRKDGSSRRGQIVIAAFCDSSSEPQGFAVVMRDVTEKHRSLEALEDQKRRLRSIVETAVDAIVIIDELGTIESFNLAGERLFGYRAEEVIGRNVSLLMPQPFADEHTGYIQRYLRSGQAKIIGIGREVQARRKDGSLFPADLAVSEFHDGKVLFTGILRDKTDRRRLENEVLEIADAEQRRIGQELHDDVQQQLSGLSMIARYAADTLAAYGAEEPKLADVHAKINRVVQGLRDANQSLRALTRGLVPLHIDAHGLQDALANLAQQVSQTQSVICRLSAEEGLALRDGTVASHLYRIAQEAVTNALKHGAAKTIDIRLKSVARRLVLEIVDDGVGIGDVSASLGRGLQIMAYRAGLIGGVVSVRKGENSGTIVACSLLNP